MRMIQISLAIILLSSGTTLHAQEVISPEKKGLIKELLVVTEATKNAEAIMNSMSAQIEKDILQVLNQVIDRNQSLSAEQREEIQRSVAESAQRSGKRFRELFNQRINYSQLVEELSYEIYDKHYSTEEIRDLLAFYKSPTGLKTIKIMPQIFLESMTKTSERLTPQLQPLVKEIIDEEMKRVEKLMPSKEPQKKQP